jgi:uncharacterized protein
VALRQLVRRFPLVCYFALAYGLSGVALAVIGLPKLAGESTFPLTSLLMFPAMVIGIGISGVVLPAATAGRAGLKVLRSRMTRWPPGQWFFVLLIPPVGIVAVLSTLRLLVSPSFAPGFLAFGFGAGILAGFFEEIGWTGFAYPRLNARFGALRGALLLGVLWGVWHLPVVDSLGAASPHGQYWPAFFAGFVALVAVVRVLIAWVYSDTGNILAAQLLHASSTGSLVVLGAPGVSPAQEALWYVAYAGLLWVIVGVIAARYGSSLTGERLAGQRLAREPIHSQEASPP